MEKFAIKFLKYTNRNIFLTGGAGTGKTTFLRNLKNSVDRRYIVLAPTSIAAINAEGNTIHSFFQFPVDVLLLIATKRFNPKLQSFSKEKKSIISHLEIIVIDEISMVRADIFDAIDKTLRIIRCQPETPFGGIRLLLIGDLFQLPPVLKAEETEQFKTVYPTPYFFGAHITPQLNLLKIELTTVYRQTDDFFISILNKIRNNSCTEEDIELLNRQCSDDKSAVNDPILLTTHNYKAAEVNLNRLLGLKEQEFVFDATTGGDFPESLYPMENRLTLKKGARVIFIKNDTSSIKRFHNGQMGIVSFIDDKGIQVRCENGETISATRTIWTNSKYHLNEKTKLVEQISIGEFHQFPLQLAWAITIHKSQGLTFDTAIIDVKECFLSGQLYVALSRVKSLNGLSLASPIKLKSVIVAKQISAYLNNFDQPLSLDNLLSREMASYTHTCLVRMFSFQQLKLNAEEVKNCDVDFDLATNATESVLKLEKYAVAFANELSLALSDSGDIQYKHVSQRIKSAVTYFDNALKNLLARVEKQESEKPRIKEAVDNLRHFINDQIHQLSIAVKISEIMALGETIETTLELIDSNFNSIEKTGISRSPEKKREKKSSTVLTDEILKMLMDNVELPQIAIKLEISESVIDQTITKGIYSGYLNAENFVDGISIKIIREIVIINQDKSANFIKSLLPSSISLREVKFIMAEFEKTRR